MRRTVDVWLDRRSLAQLRPPPASIVDGRTAECIVRACCLRAAGVSRLAVSLPVDEATANRFARTCRHEAMWDRRALPLVLVVGAAGLVPAVIGTAVQDLSLLLLSSLIEACLAVGTLVARSVISRKRSRHHPVLAGRGYVLVRDVDWETARSWADLNPVGTIVLRPR